MRQNAAIKEEETIVPCDDLWLRFNGDLVLRRYREEDLKKLIELDREMSEELLGEGATSCDPKWLQQINDPERKRNKKWRTLAVTKLTSCHTATLNRKKRRRVSFVQSTKPVAFILYKKVVNTREGHELERALSLFSNESNR
eukprot:UN05170